MAVAVVASAPAMAGQGLTPFEATFNVSWRGMSAGTAQLSLRKVDASHWAYDSRNVARGVFRVAVPDAINQSSEFTVRDERILPLHFRTDAGGEQSKRDVDVRFDWSAGRATGTAEGKPVDVALQPGLQDSLSVQIALIHELEAGRTPSSFTLLDGDEIKDYEYARDGEEELQTALGPQRTIRFRSRRPNSDRSTLFWCAPQLGHLPVKVERQRGSKVEWSMSIATLERR